MGKKALSSRVELVNPVSVEVDAERTVSPVFGSFDTAAALEGLEKRLEQAVNEYALWSGLLTGGLAFGSPVALAGLFGLLPWGLSARKIAELNALINVMGTIYEEFQDQGVEVIPDVVVGDLGTLDLFVRFPSKIFFLISVRTKGKSQIVFHEQKEQLFVRRAKSKGFRPWKPDPVPELSRLEIALKKNMRELYGGSSRGSRRPAAKVIVLTGDTKVGKHREHLYQENGGEKFLWVRNGGSAVIIEQQRLATFIKAFLVDVEARSKQS